MNAPELVHQIYVPSDVISSGRTAIVRVPNSILGGPPQPYWGYTVVVTGAVWDKSFSAARRAMGTFEESAYAMPVLGIPETYAFGGAEFDRFHPNALDILMPTSGDQKKTLSNYSAATQRYATIPMIYPDSRATALERGRLLMNDDRRGEFESESEKKQ